MGSYHHVAHQEGNLTFFVPPLFQHGQYYNGKAARMLIDDLLRCLEKSKYVCNEYYQRHISCLFWNNHPIRRVSVLGIVMGFKWKWINEKDYAFLFVDDFSSRPDGENKFLACKCQKEVLLNCRVAMNNLTGRRLRLSGEIDLYHEEIAVDEIEVCEDLMGEVEHWQLSLALRNDLDFPWELSREVCEDTLTQDSLIQNDAYDGAVAFTTPLKRRTRQDFVEELLAEHYKEELEIVSPYLDGSQREDESLNDSLKPPPFGVVIEDSVPHKYEPFLLKPAEFQRDPEGSYRTDKSIYTCNEAEARVQVVRYLLSQSNRVIPVVELYQASQINDIVKDVSTIIFNRQNLLLVKPLELLRTETFFEIIEKLVTSSLVKYGGQNVIDITPLKELFSYITNRLSGFLKLQCYIGIIEVVHIRAKLSLPTLSQRAVLDVLKEALKALVDNYPNVLTGWWIETKGNESIHVHLEYHELIS